MSKRQAPHDEGLAEISHWFEWFLGAQLAVIAANVADGSMRSSDRPAAETEARRLASAVRERMIFDYEIRQGYAPRSAQR